MDLAIPPMTLLTTSWSVWVIVTGAAVYRGQGCFIVPDGGQGEFFLLGRFEEIGVHQLRRVRQGRDAAGPGPLLEGASGGGVHGAGVGGHAAVEGFLDAATVLAGEAGGHPGQEAVGRCLRDRYGRVLQGPNCSRPKCPIRAILGRSLCLAIYLIWCRVPSVFEVFEGSSKLKQTPITN